MGNVIELEAHARMASIGESLRAAKLASASKVTPRSPRAAAKPTMPGQWGLGMPRERHPLTVLSDCASAVATSPVPPAASTTMSHVISMEATLVRKLRTCQALAICETTIRERNGQIPSMDADIDVARRLIAVREHFKLSQVAFAGKLHIAKNTLNGFETGKRPLTMETAKRIRQRFGISTDWLLYGDVGQPSHNLVIDLGPAPAVAKDSAPAPAVKRKRTG